MGLFDWLRGKKKDEVPVAAEVPVDPQEFFVRELEVRLAAHPGVESVARVPATPMTLQVKTAAGELTMFLGNLFHDTRELEPEAREALIDRHVQSSTQVRPAFETWAEAEPHVVISLRGPLAGGPGEPELAAREVLPCVREHLVLDGEHDIALVSAGQLTKWNVSFEHAAEAGRARLQTEQTGDTLYDEAQRIWTVETDDAYESSRLLVPGFLASFEGRVNGRPIAIAPTRDQVFIAGDADPAVVVRLCELAEREFAASPRRISAALYALDAEGSLCRYRREGEDACAQRVRAAHVRFEGTEYSAQKKVLEAHVEATGEDLFIANFSGIEHQLRGFFSFCAWAPGVLGLLPRTDLVGLGSGEAVFLAPWDEVMRVAGAKLQREPHLYPFRWRTVGTLDESDLAALRQVEFKLG